MARRATSLFGAALAFVIGTAYAQVPDAAPSEDQLRSILARVTIHASSDARQQIVDAIASSPTLAGRVDGLITQGRLTAIDVVEPTTSSSRGTGPFAAAEPVRGPFAAAIDGSTIVLSSGLLRMLRTARLVDVANPADVFPNQTLFVLAHLTDHLEHPVSRMPQRGENIDAYQSRMIGGEATAYVAAWNATVEEAIHRRNDAALSATQVASLLVNCRYRFAYLTTSGKPAVAPQLSPSGLIEPTPANLDAISQTLRTSSIADLE